jgi:tight adherence protein C
VELLIAITVFVSVTALLAALFSRPTNTVQRRLETYRDFSGAEEPLERPTSFLDRVLRPVVKAGFRMLRVALPSSLFERLAFRLTLAGDPVSVTGLMVIWVVCAGLLPALYLLVVTASGGRMGPQQLGVLAVLFVGGAYLPHMWLKAKTRARQSMILKTLPDAIDLLTTSVEAGLGIDAGLGQVSEKVKGPISVELRRVLREMAMGAARREALKAFALRTGVPDIKLFVNALIQAESMGVSLGQVIRVQADQMRLKRRQRAEQQAYKAPVKMVFPLVLFIFPSVFVVILGPAVIQVMNNFSGVK